MFLIHQYLIPFHAISYTPHTHPDKIFYHKLLFDTLLSVSKCISFTFEFIKSESEQGVQLSSAQKCSKV